MEDLTGIILLCSARNMQRVELHCGAELPKRMGALAFPKRSRLIEPISRVTEFLVGMRKVGISQYVSKLVAKKPHSAVKTLEKQDRPLDFQAISILLAVLVGMDSLALIVALVECICWRRWRRLKQTKR